MEIPPGHLVGLGGAVGATLRYLVGEAIRADAVPVDTLTVNVVGSFALGLVTALAGSADVTLLVGTGVCGSFTTYSSFSVETIQLYEQGRQTAAVGYAVGTLVVCGLAVGLAWVFAGVL